MFSKKLTRFAAIAAMAILAVTATDLSFAAQSKDVSAFVGTWKINLEKTKMGRLGPTGRNLARDPTFTWVFTPEGAGLKMDVYEKYPQPEPSRSFDVLFDGKTRRCLSKTCLTTGGDPKAQSYTYWRMDPHMLARLFYTKGEADEYSTYAVSKDGKTLTIISWSPATPEYQNIQVFDKQP